MPMPSINRSYQTPMNKSAVIHLHSIHNRIGLSQAMRFGLNLTSRDLPADGHVLVLCQRHALDQYVPPAASTSNQTRGEEDPLQKIWLRLVTCSVFTKGD